MFFNPKMHFLRNPIPHSFWEASRTEGKEDPVFDSTTGAPLSAKLREPQRGNELSEEKIEFKAFWRKRRWRSLEETAANAAAVAAAAAILEKWRGGLGGWGRENTKGKRSDAMFVSEFPMCYRVRTLRHLHVVENYCILENENNKLPKHFSIDT